MESIGGTIHIISQPVPFLHSETQTNSAPSVLWFLLLAIKINKIDLCYHLMNDGKILNFLVQSKIHTSSNCWEYRFLPKINCLFC
jgi:hypothetical protein